MTGPVEVVPAAVVAAVRLAAFSALGASPGGVNASDTDPSTRHTGVRLDGDLAAVATLTREASPRNAFRPVWRVRGMATRPAFQGRGLGGLLLAEALTHVAAHGGGLVWGNLRLAAVPFYERHGFVVADDVFRIANGVEHRYGELTVPPARSSST
ncbi:GNAT family N-acetyltransferase [Spongisporangium articulatum]|uniref:GNAT family N-acetyltransferase n=1 Tax=Spongisporangium articulatum TaxID=3362603 RepID=A0ABW8ARQ6_9ACTN